MKHIHPGRPTSAVHVIVDKRSAACCRVSSKRSEIFCERDKRCKPSPPPLPQLSDSRPTGNPPASNGRKRSQLAKSWLLVSVPSGVAAAAAPIRIQFFRTDTTKGSDGDVRISVSIPFLWLCASLPLEKKKPVFYGAFFAANCQRLFFDISQCNLRKRSTAAGPLPTC